MALINAVITNKENTLVTELPKDYLSVYEELCSIGCRKALERIPLTDNEEDDIRVKLYADSDIGNHLLFLLTENSTLADANTAAFAVQNADEDIKQELEQNLLHDQYTGTAELLHDIKDMTYQTGQVKMSFFCPLDGNIDDSEYGDTTPVGNLYLKSYEWDIRELLEMEQSSPEDEMAQFFNDDDAIKKKLVSAEWTVDEYKGKLYGRIDCRFKEELTEDETEIFKDWLLGQCSDGFGEHFEQQPIHTEDGDLFVSFWHSGDNYFLCTEDELDGCIEESQKPKSEKEKEKNDMNEYERLHRLAGRHRETYPPGTRLELIDMNDPYAPVPSGTRGTVDFVDDMAQIHMKWDNGRTLALNSDEDSFRKLTQEELAEEQETQDDGMDESASPVMGM